VLTVLDDSCPATVHANASMLADAARLSRAHLTHLLAEQVHNVIARATGGPMALWQERTAPRDIAPLRNLSLLLSAAVDAQTTVLVDDDISCFDLDITHCMLDTFEYGHRGVIAGAEIGGTTEQDTVTRLSEALQLLETRGHNTVVPAEQLFRVQRPPNDDDRSSARSPWASAGYLAFRLAPTRLFAFPPGYNEDWLWCLLHDGGGDTLVLRANQAVVHAPLLLRRSTRDDIVFELAGGLVLDYLVQRRDGRPRRPGAVLEGLAQHPPDPCVMPLVRAERVRAERVLQLARQLLGNGHGRAMPELEGYGLRVLREMLRLGDLEMDGNAMLNDWSRDAAAKHTSFAATLGIATARASLCAMLEERRL
jgi:hypothetical protein